jgi:hypothetical protein
VITDAKDILDVDFACYTTEADNTMSPLKFTPDATNGANTLTLESIDGNPIQPMDIKNIFFGNSTRDQNLCGTVTGTSVTAPYYTPA